MWKSLLAFGIVELGEKRLKNDVRSNAGISPRRRIASSVKAVYPTRHKDLRHRYPDLVLKSTRLAITAIIIIVILVYVRMSF